MRWTPLAAAALKNGIKGGAKRRSSYSVSSGISITKGRYE
jgi:hypothetical protein